MAKQYLHFVVTAIRACNELDVLRSLEEEGGGGGVGGGGGGRIKATTTNEGRSLKCYILYRGIR